MHAKGGRQPSQGRRVQAHTEQARAGSTTEAKRGEAGRSEQQLAAATAPSKQSRHHRHHHARMCATVPPATGKIRARGGGNLLPCRRRGRPHRVGRRDGRPCHAGTPGRRPAGALHAWRLGGHSLAGRPAFPPGFLYHTAILCTLF